MHATQEAVIEALKAHQELDGSFAVYSSANPHDFQKAIKRPCTFPTMIVLRALPVGLPGTEELVNKAIAFLESQFSEEFTINYWPRGCTEETTFFIPDDIDSVACAVGGILKHRPHWLTGERMAKLAKAMTHQETKPGGPYRSWYTELADWEDIDPVINANLASMLTRLEIQLPPLHEYLSDQAKQELPRSIFYTREAICWYFLSRSGYTPPSSVIERWKRIPAENPLDEICRHLIAGLPLSQLHLEDVNQGYAMWIDPALDNVTFEGGSPAMTLALWLEANHRPAPSSPTAQTNSHSLVEPVQQMLQGRCDGLPSPLKECFQKEIERLFQKPQAATLANFARDLHACLKPSIEIPESTLIALGTATCLGWIAYTIYDGFYDAEPNLYALPVANLALRELTQLYLESIPSSDFHAIYRELMDKIDAANTWEIHSLRLRHTPEGWQFPQKLPHTAGHSLADRSLGHALTPLAVLQLAGYPGSSLEAQALLTFYRHYLTARQLEDEAHDWEDDLEKGLLNEASLRIFHTLTPPSNPFKLAEEITGWREHFWQYTILDLLDTIDQTILAAKAALQTLEPLLSTQPLRQALAELEQSAQHTRDEQARATTFIQRFTA